MYIKLLGTILSLFLVEATGWCSKPLSSIEVKEVLLAAVPTEWSKEQTAQSDSLASIEESVHQQVNQYRQSRDLPPLTLNSYLSQQARAHSDKMAQGSVPFSHAGFKQRAAEIAKQIPYARIAENVAYNQGFANPATNAVEGWIDSPGHQQNMVENFNLTGVGVARNSSGEYYFTQIFILSR